MEKILEYAIEQYNSASREPTQEKALINYESIIIMLAKELKGKVKIKKHIKSKKASYIITK